MKWSELSEGQKEKRREYVRKWRRENPGKSSKPMREWTRTAKRKKYEYLRDKIERAAWRNIGSHRDRRTFDVLGADIYIADAHRLEHEVFYFEYRGSRQYDRAGIVKNDLDTLD